MRRLTTIVAILSLAALIGCTAPSADNSAKPPEPVYTGPKATDSPSTWTQGKVFRVWPYEHGQLMAYLGADDGVKVGDHLVLMRGGVMVNSVEVVDVQKSICTGRAIDYKDEGALPKEGDIVMKLPPGH